MITTTVVFYSVDSKKDLHKIDRTEAQRIISAISKKKLNNPLETAKMLKGIFAGLYRYRIGDYRVIFEFKSRKNQNILTILKIKHRRDVYKR